MFKMTRSCHNHGYSIGVAVINAELIFDRTTRLDHRGHASGGGGLEAVREREERVRRQDRADGVRRGLAAGVDEPADPAEHRGERDAEDPPAEDEQPT